MPDSNELKYLVIRCIKCTYTVTEISIKIIAVMIIKTTILKPVTVTTTILIIVIKYYRKVKEPNIFCEKTAPQYPLRSSLPSTLFLLFLEGSLRRW